MGGNEYHFITRWRASGTVEEISDILENAPDLKRWWPSVYLDVQQPEPGDRRGVGKVVCLYTKGWLPYTLRWAFRVTESRYPHGYSLEAWGDLVGRGIWTFEQDAEWVNVTYDWRVRANKPLLHYLSFLLEPIFSANHRWAMRKGEESLRLELGRRRAATPEERIRIPAPPRPTTTIVLPLLLGIAAVIGLTFLLSRWLAGH
jgi:hypothetical protein